MMIPLLMVGLLQSGTVAIDRGWELSGVGTRIASHRGSTAIVMNNGNALRRDVALADGTIEFDVELVSRRTFVYFQFRMESDREFEEVYFRPHKTGLPDAVQYNPVWRGDSFWQLWHGPGATASPRFKFGAWTHVRVVLEGQRGALFLDGNPDPVMVMNLARAPRSGFIAFRAFTPDTTELGTDIAARFANVVVRPVITHNFGPSTGSPVPDAGSILRWQISPAFKAALPPQPLVQLPQDLMNSRASWPAFEVERTGVVAIGRHIDRPRPLGGAIARLVIRSSGQRLQRLHLGFSDYVTVFVNGTPIFAGDAHYSFDNPRQEGLITRSQSTLWLPLRDGENEILLAILDGFGGWGLTGRLDPADGGVLVPPP